MLVLSRKVGQSIQIGEKIRVTVTQVRGGRVRIGIEAPPDVAILRNELLVSAPAIPDLPGTELSVQLV